VTSPLCVIGYVRCSTTEQATDGMSLEAQRARIVAWCAATGAELSEIIEDAGVSGSKALAERPGGARVAALLEARRPKVDAVVVLRLDRLGRDAAETLALLRRFRTGAVGLVSISDRIDLGTPQGRAMAQMGAVFAELERALVGQRTAEALAELRSQGRVYGPTPFGWKVQERRLVPNAAEQAVIERMAELRRDGLGYASVAERLNDAGLRPKRAPAWSAMAVRSVLRTTSRFPQTIS
jgi:DNA invertase Pin-like site-specific DNA recombinase